MRLRAPACLAICISLNRQHNERGIRFLFLTGDTGIHRVIDLSYINGDAERYGFPSFNFVRRPVQMSEYFSALAGQDAEAESELTVASLQLLFDQYLSSSRGRLTWAYNLMYPETRVVASSDAHLGGSGRFLRSGIQFVETSSQRARQAALLLHTRELLRRFSDESQTNLKPVSEPAIMRLLELAVAEYRKSIQIAAPYIAEDAVRASTALLDAIDLASRAIMADRGAVVDRASRSWRRMPCFPRFSEEMSDRVRDFVNSATDDPVAFYNFLGGITISDIFLFNTYVFGLLGDWESAIRYAGVGRQELEALGNTEHVFEITFLHAVALRHKVGTSEAELATAQAELESICRGSPQEGRFKIELAANRLAWIFHIDFYGWNTTIDVSGFVSDALKLLDQSEGDLKAERDSWSSELVLRARTQLWCDYVLCYFASRVWPGRFVDIAARLEQGGRAYLQASHNAIDQVIADRGGIDKVSYYVRFCRLVARIFLDELDGRSIHESGELLGELEGFLRAPGIIEYDKKKIRILLELFGAGTSVG